MINIAVLGYGTVGSGVVEVIEKNKDVIDKRAGEEIYVKYVWICVIFRAIRTRIGLYMIIRSF